MYEYDYILNGEKCRAILKDLSNGDFESLNDFIYTFKELTDEEFSDIFTYRLQMICRFLIDIKEYDCLKKILEIDPISGTFESCEYESEECVISYAIRKIESQDVINDLLKDYLAGDLACFCYEYENPLMVAVSLKKYKIIKTLFKSKICREDFGVGEMTLLQYAIKNNDYELVKLAIEELNHNPNFYDDYSIPPIVMAASVNNFEMVNLLIDNGADVSAVDFAGHNATYYCKTQKMLYLLKKHGTPEDSAQLSLVCRTVMDLEWKGLADAKVIESILEYPTPIFVNRAESIILLAAKYGDINTLETLLPYFKEENADDLICATFSNYKILETVYNKGVEELIEITDILLQGGVVSSGKANPLSEPYHLVASRPEIFVGVSLERSFKLFDNIKKLGYKLSDTTVTGHNVFQEALTNINVPLIEYCKSQGMNYLDLDTEMESAVEVLLKNMPMSRGFKEKNTYLLECELKKMLAAGCDINHKNSCGQTPLHRLISVRAFKEYPIRLLLKYNADITLKNSIGETAYDIALRKNLSEGLLAALKPR